MHMSRVSWGHFQPGGPRRLSRSREAETSTKGWMERLGKGRSQDLSIPGRREEHVQRHGGKREHGTFEEQ